MFKIKHHCTDKDYFTYQELILDRINKDDLDSYIETNHKYDVSYTKYANMEKGIDILHGHIEKGNCFGILVDVDVDGYSSSAILKMFLEERAPTSTIEIIHHTAKTHGLYDENIEEIMDRDIDCLILPDSSSNDIEEILYLSKFMDIIVIDHHDISNEKYYSEDVNILGGVALINNQAKTNSDTNKHLTGSGMTLRFIEGYYDKILNMSNGYQYYDLAMIGLIGDMADYSDYEVRNIVFKGLENLNNKLIKTALKEKLPYKDKYIPLDIAFNFNPFINAVTRVASMDEKITVFNTLSDNSQTGTLTTIRKRKIKGKFVDTQVTMTPYEYVFDMMNKIKGRQDRLVKKLEQELYKDIREDGGVAVGVIDEEYKGITGLVANRVSSTLQKPTLLLRDKDDDTILSGSARGNTKILDDFKTWCQGTDLFELAEGHDNAFGIQIHKDYIEQLMDMADNIEDSEKIYHVDITFDDIDSLSPMDIAELNELKYLTGGSVDEIKIGFHNITVSKQQIKAYKTVSKIQTSSGIEFIIFNDNGKIEDLTGQVMGDDVQLDIVGTPSENFWLGRCTYQIIVDDVQLSKQDTLVNVSPVVNDLLF